MGKYDDIIGLPHHQSLKHPHMPVSDRAAQFAPFAALSGYGDAIAESGRLTEEAAFLSEDSRELLDRKLSGLILRLPEKPEVTLTYFVKDPKKEGGAYRTCVKTVKKLDEYNRELVFTDGSRIPLADIYDIMMIPG